MENENEYEKDFGGLTHYLVKTPLIIDRAIAEKVAEECKWKCHGSTIGRARIITKQKDNKKYFLIYRYLDTSKLLIAYYDIGNSKESKE